MQDIISNKNKQTDAPTDKAEPIAEQTQEHVPLYQLSLNEKTGQVFGIVAEEKADPVVTPERAKEMSPRGLDERLKEEGFDVFFFPPNSKEKFLKQVRKHMAGHYLLGERRDAQILITVPPDGGWARIQTTQAWGGKTLTPEAIKKALDSDHICDERIHQDRLTTVLAAQEPVDVIIAEAKPPDHGTDAIIEPLVDTQSANKELDTSQLTAINQLERNEFTFVEENTPLMRKTPATKGSPGQDVHGKSIAATPGRDIPFSKPFEGVKLSDTDENLLIAEVKGHPIVGKTGVKVDPVLAVDSVNINSGNISYDGSLVVKGDICSGFKVSVSGDVVVRGAISNAEVIAGGNITVSGGVLGHETEDENNGARLSADGNISAKFLNLVNVNCGGELSVNEYIMNSHITSRGLVTLGKPTGRGCVIGGYLYSDTGLSAKVLGSDAYVATCVNIGNENNEQIQLHKLRNDREQRGHEFEQLNLILAKIQSNNHPTNVGAVTLDKFNKIKNTIEALRIVIEGLDKKIELLEQKIELQKKLFIKVSGQIFPNVIVSLHGRSHSFEETRSRLMIVHEHNKTIIQDYPIEKSR